MFPQAHRIAAEYCSAHTTEECINFVNSLIAEPLLIVAIGLGIAGLLYFGYYLYNKIEKNMELMKNILKTIGILILVLTIMIAISVIMSLIFFFARPLYLVICGMMVVILAYIIWEAVTNY